MINVAQLDADEQDIIHYGAVRLRVNGSGNLRFTFQSLDNQKSQVLVPIVMQPLTDREPTRLANFTTQRAFLRVETTAINEIFKINRIIVFARPIYTSFPG